MFRGVSGHSENICFLHIKQHHGNSLKIGSVRVSSIQIIQVRVQNKGKSIWKSRYDGDVSLNTAMTYKIGTKALSAILDAMKLIRSPPVDSCSEYDPYESCSKLPHIERQHGIAFLWVLWFIMSGQPTLYAMKQNLKNMLPLLFFNMFLFFILYLVRTVCSLSGRGAGTSAVNSW